MEDAATRKGRGVQGCFRRDLLGAGLVAARAHAGGLGVGFGHVFALLGFAVVAIARAVVDLGAGVGPHLVRAAAGGNGCCCRLGRCSGCRFGGWRRCGRSGRRSSRGFSRCRCSRRCRRRSRRGSRSTARAGFLVDAAMAAASALERRAAVRRAVLADRVDSSRCSRRCGSGRGCALRKRRGAHHQRTHRKHQRRQFHNETLRG